MKLALSVALAAVALLVLASGGMARVTVEKIAYGGWPNCLKMSNGIIELVATTDIGPRIIRFGFAGERNEFGEMPDQMGLTGGDEWRIYGGHRLWHAPERKPRSYSPDNSPIEYEIRGNRIILTQPTEPDTRVRKQMIVEMAPDKPAVRVVHVLRNEGLWPIKLAAWCLTVMAKRGMCILPWPRGDDPKGLLPNRALVLWPYTDPTDPRLTIGRRYVLLRQDPNATTPCKIGVVRAKEGWIAYVRDRSLFVKRYDWLAGAEYPDYGCAIESYTNADFIECETVGPLQTIDEGEEIRYVERWYLLRMPREVANEDDVEAVVRPLVEAQTR